jgi:PLP dependent protein
MNERWKYIQDNIRRIQETVEQVCRSVHRDPAGVKIMAVSKTMPAEDVLAAFNCGITVVGENMVQEAQAKYKYLQEAIKKNGVSFHFIGHLQSNKVKSALEIFDSIDSVDRLKIAEKLQANADETGKSVSCLIQTNVGEEESKFGAYQGELRELLKTISTMSRLKIQGLFAIPPYFENPEESRIYFRTLRMLRDSLQKEFPELILAELSMGMSHDYHVAIEEGATIVRIGQGIFGERKKQ